MWNNRIKPIHIFIFLLGTLFLILILLNLFYFLFSDRFDTYSAYPEMTLYYSKVMPLRLNVPEEWEITESPGDPGGVSICGLSIYIYQTPNQVCVDNQPRLETVSNGLRWYSDRYQPPDGNEVLDSVKIGSNEWYHFETKDTVRTGEALYGEERTCLHYMTTKEDGIYVFRACSRSKHIEVFRGTYMDMLESLVFDEDQP